MHDPNNWAMHYVLSFKEEWSDCYWFDEYYNTKYIDYHTVDNVANDIPKRYHPFPWDMDIDNVGDEYMEELGDFGEFEEDFEDEIPSILENG